MSQRTITSCRVSARQGSMCFCPTRISLGSHFMSPGVPKTLIYFNTLRPRQNGPHFADDIFKCIFLNENVWISLTISLKFVPKVWIDNSPALVQIMAWHRSGDKPLFEPMMVGLLMHICVTRPQWVKSQCHYNIKKLRFGFMGHILRIVWGPRGPKWQFSGLNPARDIMMRQVHPHMQRLHQRANWRGKWIAKKSRETFTLSEILQAVMS